MKVKSIRFDNIRAMKTLNWQLPAGTTAEGWHVILGDNGSGKSSFLRALAMGLIGADRSNQLWVNFDSWLRQGEKKGRITIHVEAEPIDILTGKGKADSGGYNLQIDLESTAAGVVPSMQENRRKTEFRAAWGSNPGWFSAGFGPFRRFTGGDREFDKLFVDPRYKRLAAHLSLFRENVALTEALAWLQQLYFQSLEGQDSSFFQQLKEFINQPDFLPHGTQLEDVSSAGVFFRNANAQRIAVEELSDGFRSVLSLSFELLRQLQASYSERVFAPDASGMLRVMVPGVVLIDEIDAHLHPIWQKRIGYWLTQHFPNIQFFVTTHSPLVCQAAEVGTVYRLPRPDQLDDPGGMVQGTDLNRLIYGNILEAYGTEVFGLASTQSSAGQVKLDELADLNQKALTAPLSAAEEEQRAELRGVLPVSESQAFLAKLLAEI